MLEVVRDSHQDSIRIIYSNCSYSYVATTNVKNNRYFSTRHTQSMKIDHRKTNRSIDMNRYQLVNFR